MFYRLKKALDHNKGRVKLAIALNSSHERWKQKEEEKLLQKSITETEKPNTTIKHVRRKKVLRKTKKDKSTKATPLPTKNLQDENKIQLTENKREITEEQRKMIANFK